MSVRMRHTKGHTRNRRSHHALKGPRISRDTTTNSFHLRHRVDMKTGVYRGKKIFDPTVQARSTTGEKNSNEKKQQKKESK